jgi:hypothetical protein
MSTLVRLGSDEYVYYDMKQVMHGTRECVLVFLLHLGCTEARALLDELDESCVDEGPAKALLLNL